MPSILFVCTGNIYRSPFAAAVFRQCLEKDEKSEGWLVESAGTWTTPGQPPSRSAIQTAENLGVNIRGHLTRIITSEDIPLYDLLLVMEDGHKEALLSEFPSVRGKIYLLSEAAGRVAYDIPDPAKTGNHERIFREILDLVTTGYPSILSLINALPRLNFTDRAD